MKVVYIAGKYRGPTPWAVEQNIRAAEEVAARVIQAGMMPLCPHANTRHMEGLADDEFFLDGTLELMGRCDAVLCVPNWLDSIGATNEVYEAKRLGIPVFGDYLPGGFTIDDALEHMARWRELAEVADEEARHALV